MHLEPNFSFRLSPLDAERLRPQVRRALEKADGAALPAARCPRIWALTDRLNRVEQVSSGSLQHRRQLRLILGLVDGALGLFLLLQAHGSRRPAAALAGGRCLLWVQLGNPVTDRPASAGYPRAMLSLCSFHAPLETGPKAAGSPRPGRAVSGELRSAPPRSPLRSRAAAFPHTVKNALPAGTGRKRAVHFIHPRPRRLFALAAPAPAPHPDSRPPAAQAPARRSFAFQR